MARLGCDVGFQPESSALWMYSRSPTNASRKTHLFQFHGVAAGEELQISTSPPAH
jgi:hypothetical protein